jgi:2-polyprenyl-3-methyl-5-hydroxy-6-metoxy-1,4-benzoquinol methylase
MEPTKQQHWNRMYKKPLANIPWEITQPPAELVDFIAANPKRHGQALDIGCGTGNYAQYLAKHGYSVTGIDFSDEALAIARRNAAKAGLAIEYINGDVTRLRSCFKSGTFDFIFDYSILHHIDSESFITYAQHTAEILKPTGKLLLVCYSPGDNFAEGQAKVTGKSGNEMFYRTQPEIEQNYSMLQLRDYKETTLGKHDQHAAHAFIFEK